MLYYFKCTQHWLFDLPDNSCNTLPWCTWDVRIYIKYVFINHSANIKNNERQPALLLLGYRMPKPCSQSELASPSLTQHIDCLWLDKERMLPTAGPSSLLQRSFCRQVEKEGRRWGNRMCDAGTQSSRMGMGAGGWASHDNWTWRAGDSGNPLIWVQ